MKPLNQEEGTVSSIVRLTKDIESLGVKKGDHIGLGVSFKSVGHVEGGPLSFIETLLDVVGTEGTIMIPTYTQCFPLLKIKKKLVNYIFDYRSTPSNTGLVSETLRKYTGAIRSKHPTNSVAAIGKYAAFMTIGHDQNASAYGPYSKLAQISGKILCIGIGDKLVGIRHEAQSLAGLLDIVPYRLGVEYLDEKGQLRLFVRRDKGGCTKELPKLITILRESGFVRDGKIGLANSILLPAREALENMASTLKNKPALNLCDNISCLWCRELERRLNLYKTIDNPKYYQRNIIVSSSIAFLNRLRLIDYRVDSIAAIFLNRWSRKK